VGGRFHYNLTISQSQPETGCLFHQRTCKNMGSTVLVSGLASFEAMTHSVIKVYTVS